jgi:hypothetical protein
LFESHLAAFARRGGRVVMIGAGSLLSTAALHPGASETFAGPGTPSATRDLFGAQTGPEVKVGTSLITAFPPDPVGIFANAPALSGFPTYQAIRPPAGAGASIAGLNTTEPAVVGFGFGDGGGEVIEIGLSGFNARLAHDLSAQEMFLTLWQLLSSR